MSGFAWLSDYLTRLGENAVRCSAHDTQTLVPAQRLVLPAGDWAIAGELAAGLGLRHAGVWADQSDNQFVVRACLSFDGDYVVLETAMPVNNPLLASHTPYFPGVDRLERHMRDMFGIIFKDHPDKRRWTRHQAWPEDHYPLRSDYPVSGYASKRTPADSDYPFKVVHGGGVYQVPVGPVHAGIIEPGHFRFHAMGESVLTLEERLAYVHKGVEKIAVNRDPLGLVKLAARISGDSAVAHSWAACMAMERAAGVEVPPRALTIRAILAERERIANHLGDIGAICNDVGFTFMQMQCSRLREDWQRLNRSVFGHRLLMDCLLPGGVCNDLTPSQLEALQQQRRTIMTEFESLAAVLDDHPSLEDRLVSTGILSTEMAKRLGAIGYVGKASGVDYDLRRDHRYPPYDQLQLTSPCLTDGDVEARVQIRVEEIRQSLLLLDELLTKIPAGSTATLWPETVSGGDGIGLIEGWRGEILCYLRFTEDGRVARFFPRDSSWFTWPSLEELIHGNIVPDFPVCNKSVNGSYSGQDL